MLNYIHRVNVNVNVKVWLMRDGEISFDLFSPQLS